MGCKECGKDPSRDDKCDRTLQQLLADYKDKDWLLTDVNGICSFEKDGCGHRISRHTNGTTEPQGLPFLTRAEFLEAMEEQQTVLKGQQETVLKEQIGQQEVILKEQQDALAIIKEKLDTPDHTATATVKTHHRVALATEDRPVSEFFLRRAQEDALLSRLSLSFQALVELLQATRNETRGLAEVTAGDSEIGSVQKRQRDALSSLASKLNLRVVKEVAVSSDYQIDGKKKRTYGSVDHVLVSGTLGEPAKDYSYPGASVSFLDTEHTYRPPFFALLGWEAKSRAGGRGDNADLDTSEAATGATPGKVRPLSTMTQQNIIQSSFYAKGLKEWNNARFVEKNLAMEAGDEEGRRFLPMIVSDSYCFVFQKRYLKYQLQTQQLNMDQNAESIAKLMLWALHEACELDALYYPRKQGDNRSHKENCGLVVKPTSTSSKQNKNRRIPLTARAISLQRNPFTTEEKLRFFLTHNSNTAGTLNK